MQNITFNIHNHMKRNFELTPHILRHGSQQQMSLNSGSSGVFSSISNPMQVSGHHHRSIPIQDNPYLRGFSHSIDNEQDKKELIIIRDRLKESSHLLAEAKRGKERAEREVAKIRALHTRSQQSLQEARNQIASLSTEVETSKRSHETAILTEELEQAKTDLILFRNEASTQRTKAAQVAAQMATHRADAKEAEATCSALRRELESLRSRVSTAEGEVRRMRVSTEEALHRAQQAEEGQSKAIEAAKVLTKDLSLLQQQARGHAASAKREAETAANSLQLSLKAAQDRERMQRSQIDQVSSRARAVESEMVSLRRDLDAARQANGRLRDQARSLQNQRDKSRRDNQLLSRRHQVRDSGLHSPIPAAVRSTREDREAPLPITPPSPSITPQHSVTQHVLPTQRGVLEEESQSIREDLRTTRSRLRNAETKVNSLRGELDSTRSDLRGRLLMASGHAKGAEMTSQTLKTRLMAAERRAAEYESQLAARKSQELRARSPAMRSHSPRRYHQM
eukprot:gnl/Dysnectes_brevis/3631_a4627_778.p1 GENE.gnl/Dysnectes_brevis/3631_a4627_778~~gnl/Dysnectes_brevis/3631_a4627_778.p1  ORF type:complete len:509 (-),score=72.56 gnl/Dysnectes_brevis/3631_a4627_778:53-1579(-)